MVDKGIYGPLRRMFEKARANRLWFFSSYQQLWFSPDELEKANRAGRLRWGPSNWVLRDPQERIVELMKARQKNMEEIDSIHRECERAKEKGRNDG